MRVFRTCESKELHVWSRWGRWERSGCRNGRKSLSLKSQSSTITRSVSTATSWMQTSGSALACCRAIASTIAAYTLGRCDALMLAMNSATTRMARLWITPECADVCAAMNMIRDFVSANISVRSPRKSFIFVVNKNIFWIKVSTKI